MGILTEAADVIFYCLWGLPLSRVRHGNRLNRVKITDLDLSCAMRNQYMQLVLQNTQYFISGTKPIVKIV